MFQPQANTAAGSRAGGGNRDCVIRACAQERGVVACPHLNMPEHYPLRAVDGQRMQAVGIEQWIAEQEARARRGFAYVDVRFPLEP